VWESFRNVGFPTSEKVQWEKKKHPQIIIVSSLSLYAIERATITSSAWWKALNGAGHPADVSGGLTLVGSRRHRRCFRYASSLLRNGWTSLSTYMYIRDILILQSSVRWHVSYTKYRPVILGWITFDSIPKLWKWSDFRSAGVLPGRFCLLLIVFPILLAFPVSFDYYFIILERWRQREAREPGPLRKYWPPPV